ATALTVPTLNEAGILQISPASTLVGLTRTTGADKGEPDKYYPAGVRTFGRVIQPDDVQARAQIDDQLAEGCRSTFLVHDREAYGKSLTDLVELLGPAAGLRVAGNEGIDPDARDYADLLDKVVRSGADCLFLGGVEERAAVVLFTELHEAQPGLKLFAPNGLATPSFAKDLGAGPASMVRLTSPGLPARLYPAAGRTFLRSYQRRFGTESGPYGMYGYEAMKLALLAVARAGDRGNDKRSVVAAFFRIQDRHSILGTYSIDRRGDTSLTRYGLYRVKAGRLAFERLLDPAAG
ncbi:MAG: transporter substrate-binding protein, partial [Solirubrobacterales bacterium]|nr:transporter substrate-binding protein [Solirubrobacterales bacterium]